MKTWQVQEAKQQLSRLVRAAETGEPQFISRHGEPVVVVLDIGSYHSAGEGPSFKDWLLNGPKIDDLEIPERVVEPERDTGL